MALANIGMDSRQQRPTRPAIDWDLEAPGLHRYFQPFLDDPSCASTPGVIDFLANVGMSASAIAATDRPLDILPYIQSVKWRFGQDGYLDVMSAGRYDASYSDRVSTFPWATFYEHLGGASLLDRLRVRLREDYDYVLIDSRTGVTDTSGICTVKMPDQLVIAFTLNTQSMSSSVDIARAVVAQRTAEPLRIIPVPMKVERAEKDLLDSRVRSGGEVLQSVSQGPVARGAPAVLAGVRVLLQPVLFVWRGAGGFRRRPPAT